ncbi:MAG: hypothetical protein ACMUHX_02650 [bacterium]
MPLSVVLIFASLVFFSVYALATEHGRSFTFIVDRNINPFRRFILPFIIGIVVIAVEAVTLFPLGSETGLWIKITVFLAILNGLGWGILNIKRSERFPVWKGMAVLWIFISGILIIPSLPMLILIFAMLALKTLWIWPFLVLLFIILVILNKAGILSDILVALFNKPEEKVKEFLSKNKKRIYSLSAVILMAPFVIITLFYIMIFLGWGPNVGPMGH